VAAGRRAGRERAVGERTEARVRGWWARGRGVLGRGLGGGRTYPRFSECWRTFSKNDRSDFHREHARPPGAPRKPGSAERQGKRGRF
jgi:hypothetical protein